MRRLWILALLAALEACAPPAPPALPPSAAQKPKDPAPAPMEKAAPTPPLPEPSKPPAPRIRRSLPPPGETHLPSFTFRTMDHKAAKVWLNGDEMSETPCLWTVTETLEFDPKIPVGQWPPEGARYAGSTQDRQNPDLKAEIYVAAKLPQGAADECVVYVSASLGARRLQGALRVRVEGYHYIDYTPLVNPEGEEASRLQRTIWFERTQSE